jgi:hypothetical protein
MTRVQFPGGAEIISLHHIQTGSGSHSASCPMGTGGDTDHSPLSSVEVKNGQGSTSTTPCDFMAWYLVKPRRQLHGMVLI